MCYIGSELWESKFDGLFSLVKEYIIDVWEIRLYDSDSGPGQQLHSRSSPGERNGKFSQNGKFGQNGKLGHSCTNVTKGKLYGSRDSDHAIVHLGLNVSSSAHNCGCVVDGGNAMAAIEYYYYYNYSDNKIYSFYNYYSIINTVMLQIFSWYKIMRFCEIVLSRIFKIAKFQYLYYIPINAHLKTTKCLK